MSRNVGRMSISFLFEEQPSAFGLTMKGRTRTRGIVRVAYHFWFAGSNGNSMNRPFSIADWRTATLSS